jgi:hypothetical protein
LDPEPLHEPWSARGIFDKTIVLYKANFKNILWIVLVLLVPPSFLSALLRPPVENVQEAADAVIAAPQAGWLISVAGFGIVNAFLGLMAAMAVYHLTVNALAGTPEAAPNAVRKAFSKWLPAVHTGVLEFIIVSLLFLALVIPGIIWSVYYTFAFCAVMLRDYRGMPALDYSKSMVEGRWMRVFGVLLLLGLTSGLAQFLMNMIVGAAFGLSQTDLNAGGGNLLTLTLNVVLAGLSYLAQAFMWTGSAVLFVTLEPSRKILRGAV